MKDYAKLIKEIETLQKQADVVRRKEIAGVIARIKEAIAAYGLTAADLGLVAGATRKSGTAATFSGFADDQGHTWSGRGPRPAWLRSAIDAGHSIDEFRLKTTGAGKAATAKPTGRAGKPKFGDSDGNVWTGHGRRPQWFLDALASGKTADELMLR